MIQKIAQNGQNLKYCINAHCSNWGKIKNFKCALRVLWGNFKILEQNIHPCPTKRLYLFLIFIFFSIFPKKITHFLRTSSSSDCTFCTPSADLTQLSSKYKQTDRTS